MLYTILGLGKSLEIHVSASDQKYPNDVLVDDVFRSMLLLLPFCFSSVMVSGNFAFFLPDLTKWVDCCVHICYMVPGNCWENDIMRHF